MRHPNVEVGTLTVAHATRLHTVRSHFHKVGGTCPGGFAKLDLAEQIGKDPAVLRVQV